MQKYSQHLIELKNLLNAQQKQAIILRIYSLLRRRIDHCDTELLELLNRRMRVCREIGLFKKEHNMQVVQAQRYDDIMRERCDQARELGMSPDFMGVVMQAIHEESVRQQIEVFSVGELK